MPTKSANKKGANSVPFLFSETKKRIFCEFYGLLCFAILKMDENVNSDGARY